MCEMKVLPESAQSNIREIELKNEFHRNIAANIATPCNLFNISGDKGPVFKGV